MAEAKEKKKMAMAVMSGDMDRLFGAFIIATSAAASNIDVTMFFTFWGLQDRKELYGQDDGDHGRRRHK